MAEPGKRSEKSDPNTQAFQMRAEEKKKEMCMKLWHERWNWLLKYQEETNQEVNKIREKHANIVKRAEFHKETTKSLKPVPATSTGFIGWLASKPDCQLEIYTSWNAKPPRKLPDAWDFKDYGLTPRTPK